MNSNENFEKAQGKTKMTIEQVKADLKEIQYYYAHEKEFEKANKIVGQNRVAEKVWRYNAAVRNASPRLYDAYLSLYVRFNTQIVAAEDMDCSVANIKRLNRKLCEFFIQEFTGENNEKESI